MIKSAKDALESKSCICFRNYEHCIVNTMFNMNLAVEIYGKMPLEVLVQKQLQKQSFEDLLQNMACNMIILRLQFKNTFFYRIHPTVASTVVLQNRYS